MGNYLKGQKRSAPGEYTFAGNGVEQMQGRENIAGADENLIVEEGLVGVCLYE